MDAGILASAMLYRAGVNYEQYIDGCNAALRMANCTTVNRAAMFLAQCGAESGGLQWSEELASGSEYNGRHDLGNTEPGDGPRYKGRTFIQVTGRSNYASLSQWAHGRGLVPTADYFVTHPDELSGPAYVWLGPVWYWLGEHGRRTTKWRFLNDAADAGDIVGATYIVNGGQNGIEGRIERWNHCRQLGTAILPTPDKALPSKPLTPIIQEDDDMAYLIHPTDNKNLAAICNGVAATQLTGGVSVNGFKAAGAKTVAVSRRDWNILLAAGKK